MVNLSSQRRIAASVLRCSPKKVHFNPESSAEIKEVITKADMRQMVKDGVISKRAVKGSSKARVRASRKQKQKGRQSGRGSRKGTKTARLPRKEAWMGRVRAQRRLIHSLKQKVELAKAPYRSLYAKIKGGFFRSRRHITLYIKEHDLKVRQ